MRLWSNTTVTATTSQADGMCNIVNIINEQFPVDLKAVISDNYETTMDVICLKKFGSEIQPNSH